MSRKDISSQGTPRREARNRLLGSEAAPALAAGRHLPGAGGVSRRQAGVIRWALPGVKSDRAVVLAQVGDEIGAVLRAGVAGGTVEAAPVPDEPAPGQHVLIRAPDDLPHRLLQAQLRQRVGLGFAELTTKDEAN